MQILITRERYLPKNKINKRESAKTYVRDADKSIVLFLNVKRRKGSVCRVFSTKAQIRSRFRKERSAYAITGFCNYYSSEYGLSRRVFGNELRKEENKYDIGNG